MTRSAAKTSGNKGWTMVLTQLNRPKTMYNAELTIPYPKLLYSEMSVFDPVAIDDAAVLLVQL